MTSPCRVEECNQLLVLFASNKDLIDYNAAMDETSRFAQSSRDTCCCSVSDQLAIPWQSTPC
eukprot:1681230-Amphidinium_carterae.1